MQPGRGEQAPLTNTCADCVDRFMHLVQLKLERVYAGLRTPIMRVKCHRQPGLINFDKLIELKLILPRAQLLDREWNAFSSLKA